MQQGFFAYPSEPPSCGDAICEAIRRINLKGSTNLIGWADLSNNGKFLIDQICKAIDTSDYFCADITGINSNVMFELGYAVSRGKKIWLIMDTTRESQERDFEHLKVLSTIGYSKYTNSSDIIRAFYNNGPLESDSLMNQIILKAIPMKGNARRALFYLKSIHENEAGIQITRCIEGYSLPKVTEDPREGGLQPLRWYIEQVDNALGVICHLTSPGRKNANVYNALYSIIAGLAYGFERPLMMLGEEFASTPIDYRDILRSYKNAKQAMFALNDWFAPIIRDWENQQHNQVVYSARTKQVEELASIYVGEIVAENEEERLSEYFFETAAYHDALAGKQTLFVGRRGSGKTANFLKLAETLRQDRRNIVCVIKPPAYEMQTLANMLDRFQREGEKGYIIESLWKYLLISEITGTLAIRIASQQYKARTPLEVRLLELAEITDGIEPVDFSVRLERAVERLALQPTTIDSIEKSRTAISEALHSKAIGEMRRLIGQVLDSSDRIMVLVDNLDHAWTPSQPMDSLSSFLLGLLSVAPALKSEFLRDSNRLQAVDLSLAVFLRSDIFYKIRQKASEPDKLEFARLNWRDRELLLKLIEKRLFSQYEEFHTISALWKKFFCDTVSGVRTAEYLVQRTLPRPRDLIYLLKVAIGRAINLGHTQVLEDDILEAEKVYSQYAFQSIVAEEFASELKLTEVLEQFLGSPSILLQGELFNLLSHAGVKSESLGSVVDTLCSLSFLGIEVDPDDFRFAEDPDDCRRAKKLSKNFGLKNNCEPRFRINMAFWAYLEIGGSS